MHQSQHDEWEDLDVAEELIRAARGELYVYPGAGHLIADSSLGDYEPDAAALILQRSVAFLDRWN